MLVVDNFVSCPNACQTYVTRSNFKILCRKHGKRHICAQFHGPSTESYKLGFTSVTGAALLSHCRPSKLWLNKRTSTHQQNQIPVSNWYAVPLRRAGAAARASSPLVQYGSYGSPSSNQPQPWQTVSAVCAVAMLLCNFHRAVFTALLPLVAGSLALTPSEVGLVQSSMLWGYLAGQIPAGQLADEQGGDRVLLVGLALGSLATAATAAAAAAVSPTAALLTLLVARAAMGLFSSVIMPATAAATAQWVPQERMAATLAMIYAFFNLGGVLGLIMAPHLAGRSGGWPAAFVTTASGGVLWSALGSTAVARLKLRPLGQISEVPYRATQQLPPPPRPPAPRPQQQGLQQLVADVGVEGGLPESVRDVAVVVSGEDTATPFAEVAEKAEAVLLGAGGLQAARRRTWVQVAALCWCHGVIGWGFFVLQSWVPLYLQSLGVADLANAGLLSSLPWLAAAFTATASGSLADRLVHSGRTTRIAVRRGMHAVSTLGCAAAVLPLAAAPSGSLPPVVATACLVAAVGCYGFSFGGFHAYIQDVAAADAGRLLGLTNTTSIVGGIAGNLATGAVLQATGGYGAVFWVAAILYGSSWICFTQLLKGDPISLAELRTPQWRRGWASAGSS